jgi:hypothetical protein
MTRAGVRVTLKLHRFEVGAGVLLALAVGLWASFVEVRLRALSVDASCITNWLNVGAGAPARCAEPMRAWGTIVGSDGARIGEIMRVLPFAVGLLGGVPIVARELEARTSATAWSLYGSRIRWLMVQSLPILAVITACLAFVAVAAGFIADHRLQWGEVGSALDIGSSGVPVIARGFGAFGIGLLAGVLLSRSIPGLLLGTALCVAMTLGSGVARDQWMATLPSSPITAETPGITTGFGWRAPDGRALSLAEGFRLVPDEIAAGDGSQQGDSAAWLGSHGYAEVQMGIPYRAASAWATYDAVGFGFVGLASIAAAGVFVNRRRTS